MRCWGPFLKDRADMEKYHIQETTLALKALLVDVSVSDRNFETQGREQVRPSM